MGPAHFALEPSGNATVVTRAAIQPSVSLRLSRNIARTFRRTSSQQQFVNQNQNRVPVPQKGPVWFRKMDRNADGDVSRAEFLGTKAEFDAIDTDHDGLISLEEAGRGRGTRRCLEKDVKEEEVTRSAAARRNGRDLPAVVVDGFRPVGAKSRACRESEASDD